MKAVNDLQVDALAEFDGVEGAAEPLVALANLEEGRTVLEFALPPAAQEEVVARWHHLKMLPRYVSI